MRTRDEIINEAIDLLSKKTGEDFHGYRSEIWIICGNVYDEASRDSRMLSAVPSEEDFQKKVRERPQNDIDGNKFIDPEYYRGFRNCYEWFLIRERRGIA